jgi:hypothetical protein
MSSSSPRVQAQTPGLVASYSFNEGTGTGVTDISGNGNAGQVSGTTWTTSGKFGGALSFDGSDDWVTIADHASLDLTTGMTIEAWVRPAVLSGYRTVLVKEDPANNTLAYILYGHHNAPRPGAEFETASGISTVDGTSALPLNTWSHLAVTYDGVNLRLFVNAVQVGSKGDNRSIRVSNGALRIGGNSMWGEYFNGLIDEVRVYNRALSTTELQQDMITPVQSGDTTPPMVQLTAPLDGSAAYGATTFTASAFDETGLAGVQFRVDGTAVGPEDTTAPYSMSWFAATVASGPHTVTAVARDNGGNITTSAPITIHVDSPSGAWEGPFAWPVVAINLIMLRTGELLMWDGWELGSTPSAYLWNPSTNAFTNVPNAFVGMFCSGNSSLADGRIFVSGGHEGTFIGSRISSIFDPATSTWTRGANMTSGRWYPTNTTLGNGQVLVVSGSETCDTCIADIPEIYNPVTNTWRRLVSARLTMPLYPFMFLLPDGRVLYAGGEDPNQVTRVLNMTTETWSIVDPTPLSAGTAVMYQPGKILKTGGPGFGVTPDAGSYVIDMNLPTPAWRATVPMHHARAFHNMTVLPDGTVLTVGGDTDGSLGNVDAAVFEAELWSPQAETWARLPPMQTPRLYHSSALLLPDGRVVVAGGGKGDGPDQYSAEIYSPPYLFRGARPTITSAPATAQWGSTIFVGTPDANITSVSLIRLNTTTHGFDHDQRFQNLSFTPAGAGLNVQMPANGNVAPPGYYMLFILNSTGVPSIASYLRLTAAAADVQPPTAPGSLSATGGLGSVSLSWTAATDNVGVQQYNVHRSTSTGFTPGPANQIAQTGSTAYLDNPAAGTYFYRITAQDAAGNVGPPSNEATATATADLIPPTVSITSPSNGSTVGGIVTITASAGDNVGVTGVQFKVDGTNVGSEDTIAPYTATWDSAASGAGSHVLTAVAKDGSNNQTTSAPVNVTVAAATGLVASYAFDEGIGTTAGDSSGNNRTGTLTGAAWNATGRFGSALSFDGVNDWVTVADAAGLDLTTGMTIEAWVNPTNNSGWRTMLMKEAPGGLAYVLYASDGVRPNTAVNTGGADLDLSNGTALPLNTWSHLAATYDGTSLRLFVNGAQVGIRGVTGSIRNTTGALRIGGNSVWGEYFAGRIDEVRVYNRALSPTEIQTDMNSPVGLPRLVITVPAEGAVITSTTVGVSYTTVGNLAGVDHVHFTLDSNPEVMDLTLDGAYQFINVPAGPHQLSGYLVRADHSKIAGTDDSVAFSTAAPDLTPPSVSVTSPAEGTTVSGTITLGASASDNVGVAGVRFRLNGADIGAEDTSAPYQISWDTSTTPNGAKILTAVARDAAGLSTTSAPVNVTVTNTAPPPPTGLVAAYNFSENTGTTATDRSGNGRTATISGATWTTDGHAGTALSFDGTNDLLTVADANALDLTTGMTLEAWVKPITLSGWRTVLLKEAPGGLTYSLYAHDNAPRPATTIVASGERSALGTSALALNAWTHLVATYDGSQLRIYVNGIQVGSTPATGSMTASNLPLRIGGNTIWGEYFRGVIDEVRIYNRALTLAEIQQNMNTPVN